MQASADGTVATHTMSLMTLGMLAGARGPGSPAYSQSESMGAVQASQAGTGKCAQPLASLL